MEHMEMSNSGIISAILYWLQVENNNTCYMHHKTKAIGGKQQLSVKKKKKSNEIVQRQRNIFWCVKLNLVWNYFGPSEPNSGQAIMPMVHLLYFSWLTKNCFTFFFLLQPHLHLFSVNVDTFLVHSFFGCHWPFWLAPQSWWVILIK